MSALQNNQFLLASGSPTDPTFPVQRSVRLRSSASAYFNRTPAVVPTNYTKTTISFWAKNIFKTDGDYSTIYAQGDYDLGIPSNRNGSGIYFVAGQLWITEYAAGTTRLLRQSNALFRDPSSWYHFVISIDTTLPQGNNQCVVWCNGVQLTWASTTNPTQNTNLYFQSTLNSYIGTTSFTNPASKLRFLDGYLTEINFIDGQALTPSSFGGYNSGTGVWEPRKYTGTYGTNGFYLNFQDNSGATATTIGKDSSGNGNNWTPNNISVTAGVTYDSMLDVPTNTSPTNANFCTLNPLAMFGTGASASNGNLKLTVTTAGGNLRPTFGATSGKYYAEFTITNIGGNSGTNFAIQTSNSSVYENPLFQAIYYVNGQTYNYSSSSFVSYGASYTTGDIIGVAWDVDNKQVTFYKNNVSQGTLSGAAITPPNAVAPVSVLASTAGGTSSTIVDINFGQQPFTYTPPSGFKSLNTYNLSDPTIASGDDFHKVYTYTGNGGGLQVGEIQKPASLFNLDRSLRFRSSATATLTRTPASAGNRKTWTWSGWVKRGALASFHGLMSAGTSNNDWTGFRFNADDTFAFYRVGPGGGTTFLLNSTQVFRDPSAWYHIVVQWDTTQATASDRIKLYVNGVRVTAFGTANYPTLNYDDPFMNTAVAHLLGNITGALLYLDGYLADVYFIDGQALTPTDFGAYDGNYYWTPKAYTGTYGTNGFHLEFEDFSAATAAAIGKDTSGQGNNWTPSGINVTTPANTNSSWDSMVDVPTSTSADVANYCTLNPLRSFVSGSAATFTNGNLNVSIPAVLNPPRNVTSTYDVFSGKWYWEVIAGTVASNFVIGIASKAMDFNATIFTTGSYLYDATNGNKYINGTASAYGATYTTNDVIGIALDMDAGTLTFYKNGVSQGVAVTGLQGLTVTPVIAASGSSAITGTFNFGQRPFRYSNYGTDRPDATFKPINSFNVSEVTTDLESPDFVWIKSRSAATGHALFNSVTGVSNYLSSNATTAETTDVNSLIQFNKNGFLLGNAAIVNTSAATYVASAWKGGSTTVTNTSGSISSQVRANQKAGFSIVTYTGTGANATVGHGLGVAPRLMLFKGRNVVSDWVVYHANIGNTGALILNQTVATSTSINYWNNTSPTSNVFTIGIAGGVNNSSSNTYVAYCFSEIAGFSKFGSYTGNGSADGPFVYLGFKPRWVLIKCTNDTAAPTYASWIMYDSLRNSYNVTNNTLLANFSTVENIRGVGTGAMGSVADIDLLSNGMKIRGSAGVETNVSGENYIYMAFAENPFKYSLAR